MKDKYGVEIVVNETIVFSRRYKTYEDISTDFKIFGNAENVRAYCRMLSKGKKPCYKNSKRYECIRIFKLNNIKFCGNV